MSKTPELPDLPKRRGSLKFKLTYAQVLSLSVDRTPVLDKAGKVKLVERDPEEAGEPYRLVDGSDKAPSGFSFRVGRTKTTYEVVKRGPTGIRRFSLGNVTDMGLDEAYEVAKGHLSVLRQTGTNPVQQERAELRAKRRDKRSEDITLRQCMELYIERMGERARKKKVKQVSVEAVRSSLARLERPEVGLADLKIRDTRTEDVVRGYDALRKSAMLRSNRIPTAMRQALASHDDWAQLSTAQLGELGIAGKYIQRVRAAGLAAAEHTFTDAKRSVDLFNEVEQEQAHETRREPKIIYNPFQAIYSKDLLRGAQDLRNHYSRAEVRNPLGDDTLPKVMKVILARRDEQGGLNAAGADYLLLTLLWGTRRSEAAALRWFDRCTPGELTQREVSWVSLTPPGQVNPFTRREGSQVYLFDTKNGDERYLPVTYFAEQVLQRRLEERLDDTEAKKEVATMEGLLRAAKARGARRELIKGLEAELEKARHALDRTRYVFPARSSRSRSGHYSDSKSIVANVRRDAGLLNLSEDIDIGLTPHDLRRTMGRYAAHLFGESRIVSQLLHHHTRGQGQDRMAAVSERYTEQEWSKLREAMGRVEEAMVAKSPRVWNRLKGTDKPRLDEANDPPVSIFAQRNQRTALDD
ncbi:integrase [Xanthomonas arboricola pv. juglandis]|uniref:integrase n=1 Tax=Xanthomonas TaxID=338 RepID=UPI000E5A888E|nr:MULTISPECIES: integrase [Xanthomonas]CAD1789466.1 integrase [Xanthomonas sp. CPBF 426]CAG2086890.1 integrase [Xanthomonas euroxanthea]SYZ54210.1 integrase [Xanthomonas arboricola pv. juglandis]